MKEYRLDIGKSEEIICEKYGGICGKYEEMCGEYEGILPTM